MILHTNKIKVKLLKCPEFEFKPWQVNDSSQTNQGTDHLVSHKERERASVGVVDESLTNDDESEVCVAKLVDAPKGKPINCSFLKPKLGKKEEMRFTFNVSKCDKLFDVLLQNNVIKLKGGHMIPTVEQLSRKKYCKWHDLFSHITNECNYFRWQIQSALNDS
jgi:hypothetical protein